MLEVSTTTGYIKEQLITTEICSDLYNKGLYACGMDTMAKRIEAALKAKDPAGKGNQSELARFVELSPQAIQKWIAGDSEPKGKNLAKAAEFLGVSAAYLRYGNVSVSQFPGDYSNAEYIEQIAERRYVAVIGTGQGGPDGYISIDDYPAGHGDGEILSNSTDNEAYAIRVRGDSMRPRIRSGEYVIAEPSFEAQPGQDVVVKLKDGKAMVKELLFVADDEIRLGSVNDDVPPITIARDQIETIHRIGAIVPRASAILRKPKGKK